MKGMAILEMVNNYTNEKKISVSLEMRKREKLSKHQNKAQRESSQKENLIHCKTKQKI